MVFTGDNYTATLLSSLGKLPQNHPAPTTDDFLENHEPTVFQLTEIFPLYLQ
ncbi:hypothetical protein IV61_GL000624 [Levilactobacillus parabrevis]|nr:hypothetical protein IV61_GL000624 [Levilactobacillus parabrevis]